MKSRSALWRGRLGRPPHVSCISLALLSCLSGCASNITASLTNTSSLDLQVLVVFPSREFGVLARPLGPPGTLRVMPAGTSVTLEYGHTDEIQVEWERSNGDLFAVSFKDCDRSFNQWTVALVDLDQFYRDPITHIDCRFIQIYDGADVVFFDGYGRILNSTKHTRTQSPSDTRLDDLLKRCDTLHKTKMSNQGSLE